MSHDRGPTFAQVVDHRKPLHVTREKLYKTSVSLKLGGIKLALSDPVEQR